MDGAVTGPAYKTKMSVSMLRTNPMEIRTLCSNKEATVGSTEDFPAKKGRLDVADAAPDDDSVACCDLFFLPIFIEQGCRSVKDKDNSCDYFVQPIATFGLKM